MRQQILKRHSKPTFCVLPIMNWNYLILEMFSSNFIIFIQHNVCSQQNFKKYVFKLLLIFFMLAIFLFNWGEEPRGANCKLWKPCDWLVVKSSKESETYTTDI